MTNHTKKLTGWLYPAATALLIATAVIAIFISLGGQL